MKPAFIALALLVGAGTAQAGETQCWWGRYGETRCNPREATEACLVENGKSYCYTGKLDEGEKMMPYKIDKNVPLPPLARKGTSKYPLAEMEVGDSFVIENSNLGSSVKAIARKLGIKVTTRHVGDNRYRVWRIE